MVRAPCCEKEGLKRGQWKPEEDQILISYVHKNGHGNWRALPKQAGLLRCGKSCRLRWINYLRPDIKRGNFTEDEEETIIKLHEMLGNRWSAIAARLPGRTDNEIKNIWHTNLKKKLKNPHPPQTINIQSSSSMSNKTNSKEQNLSPERSSSQISSITDPSAKLFPQIDPNICSEYSSNDMSSSGIESNAMNCLQMDELIIKEKEGEDKFIECGLQEEVIYLDDSCMQKNNVEGGNTKVEEDMDFWFNVFIRAEDLPDLPDF